MPRKPSSKTPPTSTAKPPATKAPAQKPGHYTLALAREICARMADGETLSQICRDERMPWRRIVSEWVRDIPAFEIEYLKARDQMLERWAEDVVEISEDGTNDWVMREVAAGRAPASAYLNAEHVQRSKLRVDSRRWLLSKLRPETYGESQRIDLKGRITLSEKEIDNQLAALVLKTMPKKGDAE